MVGLKKLLKKFTRLKNKRIITVTMNPVIDRTLFVPDFTAGTTMRVESARILAAGKGVNVSRALKSLGIPTIATGILPKNGSSYYLSLLEKESINSDFLIFDKDEPVRSNITILSNNTNSETHLREKGPKLDIEALDLFKEKLTELSKSADAVAFSGSLPLGLPDDSYERLIKNVKPIVKITALDSSGPALKMGIKSTPTLIKPNEIESRDILGFKPDSIKNIHKSVNEYINLGLHYIILSLGKAGLIYSDGSSIVKANIKIKNPVNSVGSGDASLAGGLLGIMADLPPSQIAAFSCAMGAANTLSYGACIIDLQDLEDVYNMVNLETL